MPQHEPTLGDELLERYEIVREKIAIRLTQAQFVRWAREHADWGISDRQLRNYYKDVSEMMRREESEHLVSKLDEYVKIKETLNYMLRKALEANDLKIARLIVSDIIDFQDLKNPENLIDWKKILERRGINVSDFQERLQRLAQGESNGINRQASS